MPLNTPRLACDLRGVIAGVLAGRARIEAVTMALVLEKQRRS
jgi:hypothetical protein